jgi:hypothetical protein
MDLFDYLRTSKMNTFEEDFTVDVRDGASPFGGLLGMRKKHDDGSAAKFSNTTVGTLRNGIYQLVRSDPTIATVGNWVVGRPLFWVDKALFKVSPVAADATVEFAGVAISTLTKAGTFKFMQIQGEAPLLYAAALTKAVPALNDPVVLKFAANLADGDVELDATAHSNAIVKRIIGRVDEAPVAGAVKRIYLDGSHIDMNRGIFT